MGWQEDLNACLNTIAAEIASTGNACGSGGGIQFTFGHVSTAALAIHVYFCGAEYCIVEVPFEDIVPPDYCEDHPGMCNCSTELNLIAANIENLSVTLGAAVDTVAENLQDLEEKLDTTNTNLASIAEELTAVTTIATATGLMATAQGLMVPEFAAQTIAQTGIGTAVAALDVTTAGIGTGIGAIASELVYTNSVLDAIENDLNPESPLTQAVISIATSADYIDQDLQDIANTLDNLTDCVCNGSEDDGSHDYVKIVGPTDINASKAPGGAGEERFYPYVGVSFTPTSGVTPDNALRQGEIVWVTYHKSLVPFPPGGAAKWDYVIVPSNAVAVSDVSTSIVTI